MEAIKVTSSKIELEDLKTKSIVSDCTKKVSDDKKIETKIW
jgi:hypothetical protein